jgi:D-glycero-alpha-D-manno-heptose-7-phosphate kinase
LAAYSELHGGAVLNTTINRYAFASLSDFGSDRVCLEALDMSIREVEDPKIIDTNGPLRLLRGVYNRIVEEFCAEPFGLTIRTMIDAPPGSGLGSSSAVVVALVDAFREALRLPLGRYDVARIAYEVERLDLGIAGGKQDQYAAAFGGINFIEFLPQDRTIVNPLRLVPEVVLELETSLVICFTGVSRDSDRIISDQLNTSKQNIGQMDKLRKDAVAMKSALLRGDVSEMATILRQSWLAKKATSTLISTPRIEQIWDVAHAQGARAGKISGAGGGGFMMFLVSPDQRPSLLRALRNCDAIPSYVAFSHEGVQSWTIGGMNGSRPISNGR